MRLFRLWGRRGRPRAITVPSGKQFFRRGPLGAPLVDSMDGIALGTALPRLYHVTEHISKASGPPKITPRARMGSPDRTSHGPLFKEHLAEATVLRSVLPHFAL